MRLVASTSPRLTRTHMRQQRNRKARCRIVWQDGVRQRALEWPLLIAALPGMLAQLYRNSLRRTSVSGGNSLAAASQVARAGPFCRRQQNGGRQLQENCKRTLPFALLGHPQKHVLPRAAPFVYTRSQFQRGKRNSNPNSPRAGRASLERCTVNRGLSF